MTEHITNSSSAGHGPLWTPSPERIASANLTRFMEAAEKAAGAKFHGFAEFWRWSINAPADFWSLVWKSCGVIGDGPGGEALENPGQMPGARFFANARLNFAENLLRRNDSTDALVFRAENRLTRRMSWYQLQQAVSQLQQALLAEGIQPGDRVAAVLPNMPEAVIAMLAAASLGAIWSSCSPDFGAQGILDRFGQIQPKVLFAVDGYHYNGKPFAVLDRLAEVAKQLPSLSRVIVIPYLSEALADSPDLASLPNAVTYTGYVASYTPTAIEFPRFPFNHPLYILFSSGTTGAPKCIVHGAGGTLLQHLKEHQLHCDIKRGDRVFYYTTCSWMMWNWLVSALASEATLLLYDGSPMFPNQNVLFDFADAEAMTLFGTSAKFIDSCAKLRSEPAKTHKLASLRTITSTGSPLVAESFDYIYRSIKQDVHLASISGGTDIVSCFVLGNPIAPVYRGEIQTRGLGMAVDVFDDDGRPLRGLAGELVCTKPFPSMPVGFWNDADGSRYHAAYFERFPGVWRHGDWAEITPRGGVIIYGRSDAVLNPGGVRIGTAEIYRQVEQVPEVLESICVGQNWGNDVRVVLFVKLRESAKLTPELQARIIAQIRRNATPHHVPAKILQVADIPRTRSGKIVEMAVRDVVHGRPVKQKEALANPEALDLFKDLPELQG